MCVHTYIYVFIHLCIYIYKHVSVYVCMEVYLQVYAIHVFVTYAIFLCKWLELTIFITVLKASGAVIVVLHEKLIFHLQRKVDF